MANVQTTPQWVSTDFYANRDMVNRDVLTLPLRSSSGANVRVGDFVVINDRGSVQPASGNAAPMGVVSQVRDDGSVLVTVRSMVMIGVNTDPTPTMITEKPVVKPPRPARRIVL